MLWAGIVEDELVGIFCVQEGVKLTSHTYCQFLKSFLEPWLEDVPLSRLRNLIYMHDNAPSHGAKATTQYLESIGFKNKTMKIWPPNQSCKKRSTFLRPKFSNFVNLTQNVVKLGFPN